MNSKKKEDKNKIKIDTLLDLYFFFYFLLIFLKRDESEYFEQAIRNAEQEFQKIKSENAQSHKEIEKLENQILIMKVKNAY